MGCGRGIMRFVTLTFSSLFEMWNRELIFPNGSKESRRLIDGIAHCRLSAYDLLIRLFISSY